MGLLWLPYFWFSIHIIQLWSGQDKSKLVLPSISNPVIMQSCMWFICLVFSRFFLSRHNVFYTGILSCTQKVGPRLITKHNWCFGHGEHVQGVSEKNQPDWYLFSCFMFKHLHNQIICSDPHFIRPSHLLSGSSVWKGEQGKLPYSSRFIPRGLLGARTIDHVDSPIYHWAFIIFLPAQLIGIHALPQLGSNPQPSDDEPSTLPCCHLRGM